MHLLAREPEIKIAELAGHDDIVIDRHMVQVVGREALQDARQPRAGAAAAERQRTGTIRGDAFGVEQPIQQPVGAAGRRPAIRRRSAVAASVVAVRQLSCLCRVAQGRIDAAGAGDLLQDQRAGPPAALRSASQARCTWHRSCSLVSK